TAGSLVDIAPGPYAPEAAGQTINNVSITITRQKAYPIGWTGEQTLGMQNAGIYSTALGQQFEQGFRAMANQPDADLASLLAGFSRAYGTAGPTPFGTGSDLSDAAGVRQILEDNGCPPSDLHLVLNTAAMAKVRGKQSSLFKVNEAGDAGLLRT